ncbi:uncharacterized protein LOC131008445 [Salvia miltiorrhiza]|uniref:uncharacterized protein LOC131008445 n=1 Tax=Salvia miltiorrhiza TaxID=226208 RepID=UPI0025AD1DA3|nr:uncharacterized protein LOC131008445 [Salvia miltiorrhiza]
MARGLQVGGECGVCKEGFENLWHVFFACPFAELCWEVGDFSILLAYVRVNCESFKEAISYIMDMADGELTAKVCMILWHIWKDRNKAVWEETIPVPRRTVALAISCREKWLGARASQLNMVSPTAVPSATLSCAGWHAVPTGWVRYGVDAAFFGNDNSMGIGIVIRNHMGEFVVGKTMKVVGRRDVVEGELMGVKEALSWLKSLGYLQGWVECDSKVACDAISKNLGIINERGVLANFCRRELASNPGIRLCNVCRSRNAIAHCLAMQSCERYFFVSCLE